MREEAGQGRLSFDLDHPYLRSQLIAYIGNKRALQPLLYQVFAGFEEDASRPPVFLDPFAGSGAVSRLARYMGYRVLANDWEYYAFVLNYAHLCIGRREAAGLFQEHGGPEALLARLNTLPELLEAERYISRHYAPARTENADYRRERLFYTRENALIIDAVRSRIEELYPWAWHPRAGLADASAEVWQQPRFKEKTLLLASLLYQSATHTNTSGVFKACHKGFGGHGKDALKRIQSAIALQMPVLIDGSQGAEVGCQDALQFARSRPADLCYLDPPYNQHQYGSNYHLLNTIALWDKPPVDNRLREDGTLKHKAGIRRDWTETRSAYCYRGSAAEALRELLEAIDARRIVVSYNTEGIIPFEELQELLASQGRIELRGSEYVKYRGGKQSIARQVHNLEFVLVLDRTRPPSASDRDRLRRAVAAGRLAVLMRSSFHPEKIRSRFRLGSGRLDCLPVTLDGRTVHLPMPHLYRFVPEAAAMIDPAWDQGQLFQDLQACECGDRQEEIEVLLRLLERGAGGESGSDGPALQRRVLWLLRKFAHRKYRERFQKTLSELRRLVREDPGCYGVLARGLEQVATLARARFQG
jgi:adenine-specific DNA-methyltransferase